MIRLSDAAKLATTKLRSRKVRLFITVVISGLLFSALVFASAVSRGVFQSVGEFSKEGLGQRFLVAGYGRMSSEAYGDKTTLDRAMAIYKDTVAKKKAEAKRLNIPYEPEQPPVQEYDTPSGKQQSLLPNHPAAVVALREWAIAHPAAGADEFKKSAEPFNPIAYYQQKRFPQPMDGSQFIMLKDGKETFEGNDNRNNQQQSPIETFAESWVATEDQLLQPFLLPGQTLTPGTDGSIPIVANYGAVEKMLKLQSLPVTASPAEKLARVNEVRQKAPSLRFEACYRNATSAGLVGQALGMQQEAERNKTNKDYQKPELMYGIPGQACGAVPVSRDVRSAEAKRIAATVEQFEQKFGKASPSQDKMVFRIVGLVADPYNANASSLTQIIGQLVNTSLGSGWFMPMRAIQDDPVVSRIFTDSYAGLGAGNVYFAEFRDASSLRNYIANQSCAPDFSSGHVIDPFTKCREAGKYFEVMPYGSNSLGLENAQQSFYGLFLLVMAGVAAIACVIMSGTVGKMVADSRRETAVFRAMGAKRLDIAQIYILYAVLLSLLVAGFGVIVGLAAAMFIDRSYSAEASLNAVVAYNTQDLHKTFHLFGFSPNDLLVIVGLVVGAGLLSTIVPLLRNIRRNPIRDMRDE
jgi:hypothetical protein